MFSVTWARRLSIVSATPAIRVSSAAITSALFWFSDKVKFESRVVMLSLIDCARLSNVFWNRLRCEETASSIDLMRVSSDASSVVTRSSTCDLNRDRCLSKDVFISAVFDDTRVSNVST